MAAAPVAASLAIKTPANAIVGVPVWVRVTALDASGNPVWNYSNGNLVLSSVDLAGDVPIPPAQLMKTGTPGVQVTFHRQSGGDLDGDGHQCYESASGGTSTPIDVAAAPVAASLAINAPAKAMSACRCGSAYGVDASGKPVPGYSNGNLVLSGVDLAANVPIPASPLMRRGRPGPGHVHHGESGGDLDGDGRACHESATGGHFRRSTWPRPRWRRRWPSRRRPTRSSACPCG